MASGGSHNVPQGAGRTGKRRSWTLVEEKVLLQAFKEIIAQGWKTQNGFRNGFLLQLESKMKAAIPGTDLKGEPMISSKYGTWKKTFKDIQEVLRASGFGWNSTTKTVLAFPSHVWDEFIMAHPGLAYIREKPFPFYETWVEIYGRDTATGAGAMDFQMAADLPPQGSVILLPGIPHQNNGNQMPTGNNTTDDQESNGTPHFTYDDTGAQSSATPNPSQAPRSAKATDTNNSPTESHKRKRSDGTEELASAIIASWEKAADAMNKIASRIGEEMDASQNRKWLYEAIGELPVVIDMSERLRASVEIAMNPKAMDVFIGLPDDAKIGMVHMALDGDLKSFK